MRIKIRTYIRTEDLRGLKNPRDWREGRDWISCHSVMIRNNLGPKWYIYKSTDLGEWIRTDFRGKDVAFLVSEYTLTTDKKEEQGPLVRFSSHWLPVNGNGFNSPYIDDCFEEIPVDEPVGAA